MVAVVKVCGILLVFGWPLALHDTLGWPIWVEIVLGVVWYPLLALVLLALLSERWGPALRRRWPGVFKD